MWVNLVTTIPKYKNQKVTEVNEETNKSTNRDNNTPVWLTDRTSGWIRKENKDLKNINSLTGSAFLDPCTQQEQKVQMSHSPRQTTAESLSQSFSVTMDQNSRICSVIGAVFS